MHHVRYQYDWDLSFQSIHMPKKKVEQQPLIETWEQPSKPKGLYNKYDLTSWLIKSMRMNRKHDAIQAMRCLLQDGNSQWYIAKKLVQFAVEDAVGAEPFLYVKSTYDLIVDIKDEVNALSRCVLYLCDAPKFRESKKEAYWEVERIRIRETTKEQYKKWIKPAELPEWVFDQYTARGSMKKKRWEIYDRRFSWVLVGGNWMRWCYLRYGRLSDEDSSKDQTFCHHSLQCESEQISVDEYLDKYGISVGEYIGWSDDHVG